MASKLLYLLMDWGKFNQFLVLEQVRGVIKVLQTSKIVSSVSLKTSTALSKRCICASVAKFIFSKTPCFQHMLINSFRRMRLKYENCSLRGILFYTLKQHSGYKSLIV